MPDEWYREPRWNPRVEREFEQRLSRAAAHNRPQYLRIKALTLLENRPGAIERQAAHDLLRRVISDYPDSWDVVVALEKLGELEEEAGRFDAAERHYRAAVHLSLEGNVHGDAHLRLPELLIRGGQDHQLADAEAILSTIDVERDLAFKSQRFRYAVCRARLAAARDNASEAARYAMAALGEAGTETPDFARHPDLGHVAADESVLREMDELARSGSP